MAEQRTSVRQRTFLQGRVFFNDRRSSIDCLIRDMSASGAKLLFSDATGVPEAVELHIPSKGETYRARVRRRDRQEIGISFDKDDISPVAPASDLGGRV